MNNYEEMKIESDVFTTARENFDLLMQRLFASMEKSNSDEGSITLKVDLKMKQDWVPNGEGGSVEVNKPVIKHKVTIAVPVKDSMDSKKDTGMNLVWDEELNRYVLRYINEGGQQSLFDPDYEQNLKGEDAEDENQPDTATDEEITTEEDREAPGGNPEFTDSVEDDDYEYDDPEEEE